MQDYLWIYGQGGQNVTRENADNINLNTSLSVTNKIQIGLYLTFGWMHASRKLEHAISCLSTFFGCSEIILCNIYDKKIIK